MIYMKKISLLIIALLVGFCALGQTYYPSTPPGTSSLPSVNFRYKSITPDSLNQLWIYNPLTAKYNRIYSATEANLLFVPATGGGYWQRASNRLSPVTSTDTITGNLGKIKKLTVGNYTSPLWADPIRQFVITAPGPLDTDISAMYMHNNKANILYTTSAHGNNDLGGVNSSWFYQGGYTPGLSGFDFNRVTYFSDGTTLGTGFDQVMNLVGNAGGANYNATHLLRGGMYWSKYHIDVNVDRFNPATMSHYAHVDTSGAFFAKSFSGNDGTQGLVLGTYSLGAGFGAIYPYGVTPSNLNYVFASNPSSQTIINNPIKSALAVGGGNIVESTLTRTDINNNAYVNADLYVQGLTSGSAGNFVVSNSGVVKTRTAAQTLSDIGAQSAITFGTGVQTALGVNIGSAGAPVLFNGAGGTPSSIVLTNATGTASALNIGGNAATVTNGVYTTGSYSNPSWITAIANSKVTGLGTLATQNGTFSGTSSGTNTGDETTARINTLYGYTPADGANYLTIANPIATNYYDSRGSSAGFLFRNRDDISKYSIWYASGGVARLLNSISGNDAITVNQTTDVVNIPNLTTTTQSANDNSTKVATTAYVDSKVYSFTEVLDIPSIPAGLANGVQFTTSNTGGLTIGDQLLVTFDDVSLGGGSSLSGFVFRATARNGSAVLMVDNLTGSAKDFPSATYYFTVIKK